MRNKKEEEENNKNGTVFAYNSAESLLKHIFSYAKR
jgi:hypothetical protein